MVNVNKLTKLLIFILMCIIVNLFSKTLVEAKNQKSHCNNYTTKSYFNKICVKSPYIEYKSNDTNYNHPNALYPVKAVELYPINGSSSSSSYTVKYKTVCYPYPVYYDLFLNNYHNSYNTSNYYSSSYKNYSYSGYSGYSSYSNSYSSFSYYTYYDPYYLYENYPYLNIKISGVKYYDAKTGEFKESSF